MILSLFPPLSTKHVHSGIMFLINIDKKGQAYLLFFIDKALLYTWNIWLHSQKDIKAKQIVPTQCWKVYCLLLLEFVELKDCWMAKVLIEFSKPFSKVYHHEVSLSLEMGTATWQVIWQVVDSSNKRVLSKGVMLGANVSLLCQGEKE